MEKYLICQILGSGQEEYHYWKEKDKTKRKYKPRSSVEESQKKR